jgi:hypothetical protein
MRLLQAGVDTSVIALWLGHESVQSTQVYLHADLALKEQAPPAPHRREPPPVATTHPTSCSPSSKPSNYAGELTMHILPEQARHPPRPHGLGMILDSA